MVGKINKTALYWLFINVFQSICTPSNQQRSEMSIGRRSKDDKVRWRVTRSFMARIRPGQGDHYAQQPSWMKGAAWACWHVFCSTRINVRRSFRGWIGEKMTGLLQASVAIENFNREQWYNHQHGNKKLSWGYLRFSCYNGCDCHWCTDHCEGQSSFHLSVALPFFGDTQERFFKRSTNILCCTDNQVMKQI